MYLIERNIILDWLQIISMGGNISGYFKRKGIDEVVIYGAGAVGLKLYADLRNSGISVRGIIDKSVRYVDEEVEIYLPEKIGDIPFSDGDIIVVATAVFFSEIYDFIRQNLKINVYILGYEDLIYDEYNKLLDGK